METRSAYHSTKMFRVKKGPDSFKSGAVLERYITGMKSSKFCLSFSLLGPTLFCVLGPILLSVLGSTLSSDKSYVIFCVRPYGIF